MKTKTTQSTNSVISSASFSPLQTDVLDSGSQTPSQQSSKNALPYLWVSDIICAQKLRHFYRLISPDMAPASIAPGYHIIALDPEMGELNIKRLGHMLSDGGSHVTVFELQESFINFLAPIGEDAVPMIAMGAIRFEKWLKQVKDTTLSIDEAVSQAGFYLRRCGGQRTAAINIELETLRKRCGVSSYDWQKNFIEKLEAEIHAAVDGKVTDPDELLRLELKALLTEKDSLKRKRKRAELCRRSGLTKGEIEEELQKLANDISAQSAKRMKGRDFLMLENQGVSWLFPGILPRRGVFTIGGMPGAGKTTWAYDAAGSLIRGEEFLGEKPVSTGKVLIVSADELPCYTQDKLIDRGFPIDNDDWDVITDWDISQWETLVEAITDLRPSLVIIDSFSSIHRDPNFDENSATAKASIYKLEALSNTYNFGCILIHHLTKSKEQKGVGRLRGSTAIAAASSVVALLEQARDGVTRSLSFPKMRGAQTEDMRIALDFTTGRYQLLNAQIDSEANSLSEKALAFFKLAPQKRYELDEILEGAFISSSQRDSLRKALDRLVRRGVVVKRPAKVGSRQRVYGLAKSEAFIANEGTLDTPTLSPPPPPDRVSVSIDESIDIQRLQETDTKRTPCGHETDTSNLSASHNPSNLDSEVFSSSGQTQTVGGYESGLIENNDSQQAEIIDEPVATETVDTSEVTAVEETVPLHPIAEDEPVAFSIAQEMIAVQNSSRGDKLP